MKTLLLVAILTLTGCSATTLRCGTDGQSSYVELLNLPQDIAGTTRHYKDLCAFNYEGSENAQAKIEQSPQPQDLQSWQQSAPTQYAYTASAGRHKALN